MQQHTVGNIQTNEPWVSPDKNREECSFIEVRGDFRRAMVSGVHWQKLGV